MKLKFKRAYEEEALIKDIAEKFGWNHLNIEQIGAFQRIPALKGVAGWSTPRIFSGVFETKPLYVIIT